MVVEQIERTQRLDAVSDRLQKAAGGVFRAQRVRDFLHGVWLGHPLHPAMVHAPVGSWISAAVLDLVPGQEKAATTLVAAGTASAVPTAVVGWNDWAALDAEQRRTGLVHALCNATAVALYAGSLVSRLRGDHARGRLLGFLGLGIAGAGAFLGGHLTYRQGAGANQAVADQMRIPEGWQDLGRLVDFPDGTPVIRRIGDVPVLVHRSGHRLTVLLERCGHQTGPLGAGDTVEVNGDPCVVCPWHGSTFRLTDGSVVHGPATSNQPTLEARVTGDRVEARRP
jgi:nitrite reductase/ring-hydroxylating ferredoxin subunit